MRRKRGSQPKTRSLLSDSGRKPSNTCYAYFKIKKTESLRPKLRQAEDVNKTCSLIIKEKVKDKELALERPKRLRQDSLKQSDVKNQGSSLLCIEDVQTIVASQESYDGGVNCYVCGKLYKSRVCFIKHMWEHTVYWNMFEGAKNHERVLSIQAAIILYCGMTNQASKDVTPDLCNLLVTSPHSSETKQEKDNAVVQSSDQLKNSFLLSSNDECVEASPDVKAENLKQVSSENCMSHAPLENSTKHYKENVISDSMLQMPSSVVDYKCQPWSHIPFLQTPLALPSYPASSLEGLTMLVFVSSLPAEQLSPSMFKGYENRHTSTDSYGTLGSNDRVSFVSPLKRKRED